MPIQLTYQNKIPETSADEIKSKTVQLRKKSERVTLEYVLRDKESKTINKMEQ